LGRTSSSDDDGGRSNGKSFVDAMKDDEKDK
jgi:hypothetical protein